MQALIEAYKKLEIGDKAQLPFPKPAMAPNIKAFAQTLIDFNLDNLAAPAISSDTEQSPVARENASAESQSSPVDDIKAVQSALFKFATWCNGSYSNQISNYIKPLTIKNVLEKIAKINEKIASTLAEKTKVAESDGKKIIEKLQEDLQQAARELCTYYEQAPKNDADKKDEDYLESRKTYLVGLEKSYQAFVHQKQIIDAQLKNRLNDEETIAKIKEDSEISAFFKNVSAEMEKEKIRVHVEIYKRRLRWIIDVNKEMADHGRKPTRFLTDANPEKYKVELQQLIDKLKREKVIIDGIKADLDNYINLLVNDLPSGSAIIDRHIKEQLKNSLAKDLDKIWDIKKTKLELTEHTLKNFKQPLRQQIIELAKQPGKKIIVIKLTDADARKIAGVPTGDHLKAIFHDGNDSFTWVSFGASKELKEPMPGAIGAVARLLHVPANQYQGGFNGVEAELAEIEAQEGISFEIEVLDCQNVDSDYIGLDYDRALAWIKDQMSKPASELKYTFLDKNCAYYVIEALREGGADKFLKPDHTTMITDIPVPAYAFDYVKKLYREIGRRKNEQLIQKLEQQYARSDQPSNETSIKQKRETQIALNVVLFNALLENLALPDENRSADVKAIRMIQSAISMTLSALDELAKMNQALDEANSESIVKATYVQYRRLAATIDQLTQVFPVNARPEKVDIVIGCLKKLLSYFPPAEEYFLFHLRKEFSENMKVSRDKFNQAIIEKAMPHEGIAQSVAVRVSRNIESYLSEWDAQISLAMEKNEDNEESPFRIAMRIRNVIKWVENKQVEHILVLKNLESKLTQYKTELSVLIKQPESSDKAARVQQKQIEISQYEEAVFQINELIKNQETTLIDLAKVSGKLNCYIYSDNPKMVSESSGAKIHPRNLLGAEGYENAPVDFMGSLDFKAKQLFNHESVAKPGFWSSVFGTIFPWKQNQYNSDMRKITKNNIHDILFAKENAVTRKKFNSNVLPPFSVQASGSNEANANKASVPNLNANAASHANAHAQVGEVTEEHPYTKFERIKQKIAENKPSAWNIFRRSERKHYEKMENQAQLICLLEAFGKGYIDEARLGQQLSDLANKEGVDHAEKIKQFAANLQATYHANKQSLGERDFTHFKASSIHADVSTSAKLLQLFYHATGGLPADNLKKAVAEKIIAYDKELNPQADHKRVNLPIVEPKKQEDLNVIEQDLAKLREPHW